MNIIDAIKSGKKFKRPSDTHYWKVSTQGYVTDDHIFFSGPSRIVMDTDNLLADDWELEPPEITEKRLREAVDIALQNSLIPQTMQANLPILVGHLSDLKEQLVKELF